MDSSDQRVVESALQNKLAYFNKERFARIAFQESFASAEGAQQVPPLRYAPVGMTILLRLKRLLRRICFGRNRIVIPTGA